jgi:predicted transcriptional regulator of viral defense system
MIEAMIIMSKKAREKKRKEVFEIIRKAKTISLKEIRASTSINYNTIRGIVIGLTNKGLIERVDRGLYKVKNKS